VLFGWDDVKSHGCSALTADIIGEVKSSVKFSERGLAAVLPLLSLFRLNSAAARPEDLDRLDARILCLACPITQRGSVKGRAAYPWRDAVHPFDFNQCTTNARIIKGGPLCNDNRASRATVGSC
jgi:hypothetical protein